VSLWALRGLRDGVVTTRWPKRPDEYAGAWRGPVTVIGDADAPEVDGLCPTGAIGVADRVRVDQGKCILCGRCVAARTTALRRSVHVRHVDAGSDGSEEWEIQALLGPVYDVHRLGIFFTASPRHADVLLVTGAGAAGMAGPLRATYDGMPDPRVVIAVGTDAVSGGLLGERLTGVAGHVPVDVFVPGSPPSPFGILNALLIATGKLR
jgi:Ni,Fe-hydrogenase III small subunit